MGSAESQTLLDARADYFERSGFAPDGGYHDKWVHVDMGGWSIKFPNSEARRRAVRYHDLHHVVTGYGTDLKGEAQISAWEIASGCRGMVAAWILNLLAFGYVLLREPHALYAAFVRGRHSRNLYGHVYEDALLERSAANVRQELGLSEDPLVGGPRDRIAFVGWGALSLTLTWGPIALLLAGLLRWIF
jgi:hypothetical protein